MKHWYRFTEQRYTSARLMLVKHEFPVLKRDLRRIHHISKQARAEVVEP